MNPLVRRVEWLRHEANEIAKCAETQAWLSSRSGGLTLTEVELMSAKLSLVAALDDINSMLVRPERADARHALQAAE